MIKENVNSDGPDESTRSINYGAFIDLLVVMAVLVGIKQTMLPVTQLYAGPISTLTAMFVATYLLWRRGLSWKNLGFCWPESWLRTSLLTAIVLVTMITTMGVAGWIVGQFVEDIGTSGRFDHIKGNLVEYLIILVLVWTHAAIFEELLFRAFVINRVSIFFSNIYYAGFIAAVFSAVFFGYRHYYYQGLNGALTIGMVGFVLALFYLKFGRRNILPLILAHGTVNTLGMTIRFLGVEG